MLGDHGYDADGEVTDTTDADGRADHLLLRLLGDQTGESWLTSSGAIYEAITFTYDADGEMTNAPGPEQPR